MGYSLKHHTELNWFDLAQLEHPDLASAIIQSLQGPSHQGQGPDSFISGLSQVFPQGVNPSYIDSTLQSGDYFLVALGDAQSPLLRYSSKISLNLADEGRQQQAQHEWQFSSNTYSEHLSTSLRFAINQTPEPIFSAVARQKAKPKSSTNSQDKQTQQKEIYWIDLECSYKGQSGEAVENMPYVITFSDGKTRKGKLNGGMTRINDIPAGQVDVVFGYPEAEKELVQARKELKQCLDEIILAVEARAKPLDEALQKESIPMQKLILTGAFFDGLFGTLGDSIEGIEQIAKDMADTARVKLDEWDGISDEIKYQIIETIEEKKRNLSRIYRRSR